MHRNYRRVVTGHDKNGSAIIESDQIATQILERPNRPGVRLTNFWMTDQTPAEYDGPTETCTGPFVLHPPTNGSRPTISHQCSRLVHGVDYAQRRSHR